MEPFKTPKIPEWVHAIQHPLYKNIFSYDLGNRNLWGTETLLGDWDGEYLLIAKDFYPARYITDALKAGIKSPYRHNPRAPTNINLMKTLRHFGHAGAGLKNVNCNFLYASACFLLRNDGVIRGALPDGEEVLRRSAPVITFTIKKMCNLRKVVAMGKDSSRALATSGLGREFKKMGLKYYEVSHPSRAMTDVDRYREWVPVFDSQ